MGVLISKVVQKTKFLIVLAQAFTWTLIAFTDQIIHAIVSLLAQTGFNLQRT